VVPFRKTGTRKPRPVQKPWVGIGMGVVVDVGVCVVVGVGVT
jgi:hypothetical protein